MGFSQQLKGLLKSEFLQMKRNKFLTLIEIFCPILLILLFLFVRLLFKVEKEKYDSIYDNDLEFIFKHSTNITNIKSKGDNKIDDLDENTPLPYYYFLAQCSKIAHIAIIGKNFPIKLIDKIILHFWEIDNDFNEDEIFKRFDTIKNFEKYITSKEYGTDDKLYPKICFGISQTDKFKFGIHYNTINVDKTNEIENLLAQESPHIPDMKRNKNEKVKWQENLQFFEYYKTSGYLMTLKLIYDYILQEITNDSNAEINFSVLVMKYDEIIKDNFHRFLTLLGFFIIISYSIPFSINIYREIHFREIKKKEYLKSMGVKEKVLFLTSFIRCFIINIFHSIFCSLFTLFILRQSQYIYLFLIYFFFGLVIFSMTYCFQSFLQESRIGVIISLLIFCVMSFFYLPLSSPEVNKAVIYLFCIFFPPTNLLLGLNNFYIFEKEFTPLNNQVNLDISQITIKLMIIFLSISFILYLLIGYIISKLFCYEYGINNCCSKKGQKKNIYNNEINLTEKINDNHSSFPRNNSKYNRYNSNNSNSLSKRNRINNPPKKDIKYKNDNNININNFNNINNININISLSDIGGKYIDDDDTNPSEQKEIKANNKKDFDTNKNYNEKEIKANCYNYIDSVFKKKPQNIINAKKEKLKKSLNKIGVINKKDINEKANPYMFDDDEMEIDLENQIEIQEIRNKRRLRESTMYCLKPEEHYINDNLKLSKIAHIINDPFLTKSLYYLMEDDKSKKEKIIKKKEISQQLDDFHTGARLEINNIIKKYDNQENNVLNELSFNLYENEIFSLLGQNGAGKSTFISILSGLIEANSGSIKYKFDKEDKGIEVLDHSGILEFRKILGICYQNNNILYDNLTVKENLETFCLLKFDKKKNDFKEKKPIVEEVKKLLKDFELEKEKDTLAKNLSGGYKRRLCIAIAFCGKSKFIILDEPTGGIDIVDTKKLWDILKKNKNGKIILLISHFMEEVSFLSDKIGILKNGQLLCKGTNRELIDDYGNYITIQINKKLDKKIQDLIRYIKETIILKDESDSNLINDTSKKLIDPSEASASESNLDISSINKEKMLIKIYKERIVIKIQVKYFDFSKSNELIHTIENIYYIQDYRILKDQLEDVFIDTIDKNNNLVEKKEFKDFSELDMHIYKYNTVFKKFKNELKILIFKRFYETIRNKKSFILEVIFPILLTLIACLVSYVEILEDNRSNYIDLNYFSNDTQTIHYTIQNNQDSINLYNIFSFGKKEKEKLKNYNFNKLPNFLGDKNFNLLQNLTAYLNSIYKYNKQLKILNNSASFYFVNADESKHKYEFITFISTRQRHSAIAYTNYLLNKIIKYEMKKNYTYNSYLDNVFISNSPFLLSYEERIDKKSRNGFILVFFISIALALIPANFITLIIREKENKSKQLQLLSGLSIYTYWINNYIFELTKYYVVVGICFIIIAIFKFYEKYLIIFYFFYGPALVSFTYVISYFINSEGSGQIIVLLINLIFGALDGSAVLILRTHNSLKNLGIALSYISRFIPSFCISYGYNQLISKKVLFAIDYFKKYDNKDDYERIKKQYNDTSFIIKDSKYITNDIIFIVFEMLIYTGFLIFLENKDYFLFNLGCLKKQFQNYYIDLDNNKSPGIIPKLGGKTTKREINENNKQKYPLKVLGLKKIYKNNCFNCCRKKRINYVLNNISFNVENGECFGLLGGNGVGKSTTFKCLSQEIKPDKGLISINNQNIYDFTKKQKPIIGYCPQFDSIFEYLTVKENLEFYAKLKGINEFNREKFINFIINKFDLNKFKDKLVINLSGGNKRKLSVGICIISKPSIILMDEPSTGMDPFTRRLLLDLLYKAYLKEYINYEEKKEDNSKGIVLTTHSIEEVEALCDKIGIIVGGTFKVYGKIGQILKLYSNGIELNVEFEKQSPEFLKEKYGNVLKEGITDIEGYLRFLKKDEYCQYLRPNHFGKMLLKVLIIKKKVLKISILRWVEYMDCLKTLVKEIKKYFDSVHCIKFNSNNFILKITNFEEQKKKKNDNYIFGIIENCKDKCHIEEYCYNLTTLENIFLDCNAKKEENENEHSKEKKEINIGISLD